MCSRSQALLKRIDETQSIDELNKIFPSIQINLEFLKEIAKKQILTLTEDEMAKAMDALNITDEVRIY